MNILKKKTMYFQIDLKRTRAIPRVGARLQQNWNEQNMVLLYNLVIFIVCVNTLMLFISYMGKIDYAGVILSQTGPSTRRGCICAHQILCLAISNKSF